VACGSARAIAVEMDELARRIRNNPDVTQSARLETMFIEFLVEGSPEQREAIDRAVDDAAVRAPEDRV
jgi:hypothetical protein